MTTDTDTKTPAEVRAEARAAAKAARIAAALVALAAREAAMTVAVQALLDHRAEVPGATLARAILAARDAAVVDAPTETARRLLRTAYGVVTTTAAVALHTRKDWARQFGAFLRSGADLRVGSYAVGVTGKPKKTTPCYALAILTDREGAQYVLDVRTASEVGGEAAAAAFAGVWSEVEQRADAAERIEIGGAR